MLNLITIADLFSLLNALLGFFAIIFALLGEMWISFYFILIAILADGLDGIIARKVNHGELGEYFEAMADMTSLGIAPAIFVFLNYFQSFIFYLYESLLLVVAIIVFLSLSIIRLSSFHIIKNDDFFVGLPASTATIILVILTIYNLDFSYIILALIIIAIFMVSNLPFPKPDYKLNSVAAILIFLTIIFGEKFYGVFPILLLLALIIYSLLGPLLLLIKNKNVSH